MRVLPRRTSEFLSFLTVHLPAWEADPAAVGLTEQEVAELRELAENLRAAVLAADDARSAARNLTATLHVAEAHTRDAAAAAVAKIKATARRDQAVYSAALIPRVDEPSPCPAPGRPFYPKFTLLGHGPMRLSWKCRNPRGVGGTMYEVERSIDNGRTYARLATVGIKTFTDDTLPRGAGVVVYRVRAVRSTRRGEAADFPILLGVGVGVLGVREDEIRPGLRAAA